MDGCEIPAGFEYWSAKFKPESTELNGIYAFDILWETAGVTGIYYRNYNPDNYFVMKIDSEKHKVSIHKN